MLHLWLIPALVGLCLLIAGLYLVMKYRGGSGARTDGRTIIDEPTEEPDPPPR